MSCNTNRCNCNKHCTISPESGCNNSCCECQGIVIPTPLEPSFVIPTEDCCDENGLCKEYPTSCRNVFWPSFSHPRWLCCDDLYCSR
ncbi:MAG: hypothetical protein RR322_04570 [Oscillospiraceae bacterium]